MTKTMNNIASKYLPWLFIFIIAYLPFHGFVSTWAYSVFGHALLMKSWKEVLIFAMLVASALVAISSRQILVKLYNRLINRLIAVYALLHLVMAVLTEQTTSALMHGLAINLRFLGFFLIAQVLVEIVKAPELRTRANKTLLIVATVVSAIALIQTLLPREFLEWFGYGKETIQPYFTIDRNLDFVRYAATTRGPNVLGAYLILPITMAVVLLFKKYDWKRVLQILLLSGAIALTFSRSAWLGLLTSLSTIKLFFAPPQIQKITKRVLPVLLVFGVVSMTVFITTDVMQNVVLHQDPGESGAVNSTEQHWEAKTAGLRDVLQNPLGQGPGTAGPASLRNDGKVKLSENYFLQIGQEVGVVGLALFVWINVLLGKALLQGREKNYMKPVLFASLIGLSVVSMLLHGWANEEVALTYWGIAGLYAFR